MVKVIAGIDYEEYKAALAFLTQLRFPEAEVRLLHVIESVFPNLSIESIPDEHPVMAYFREMERVGKAELASAEQQLKDSGYSVSQSLLRGWLSKTLVQQADEMGADLIAVGSGNQGAWASLFFGSVSKALSSSANQSILVAKEMPVSKGALTAVLATDHSEYCNKCIDEFLTWNARGIERVMVVTASDTRIPPDIPEANLDTDLIGDLTAVFETELARKNEALCGKLSAAGIECSSLVLPDHPNAAIDKAMNDANADLLIMGARGHGFWDRLRLGSVSHHQVVATPHNVLVIRA